MSAKTPMHRQNGTAGAISDRTSSAHVDTVDKEPRTPTKRIVNKAGGMLEHKAGLMHEKHTTHASMLAASVPRGRRRGPAVQLSEFQLRLRSRICLLILPSMQAMLPWSGFARMQVF